MAEDRVKAKTKDKTIVEKKEESGKEKEKKNINRIRIKWLHR